MKIALVIIAKDEGAVLKRCIDSFQHVVDEIHVADTGSNDHTVELARSCGATVRFYEEVEGEPFNYGRARNFAQECVKADYIFSVDADEYLHPDSKHTFRARVAEYMRAAPTAFIPIWSGYNRETLQRPVHEHVLVRLFKRGREWKYRIHEVVVAQLGTVFGRDIVLLHDKVEKGKTSPESMAKRMETYFQNMELDKKENPGDTRPYFYLATYRFESKMYEEAVAPFMEYLDLSIWGEERAQALLMCGKNYFMLKKPAHAASCLARCAIEAPARAEPWYWLGELAAQAEDWRSAAGYWEIAASYTGELPDSMLFIEREIYLGGALRKLSVARLWLRDHEGALDATNKALAYYPDDEDLLKNKANVEEFMASKEPCPPAVPILPISNRPVNIVIPTANQELVERCVKSILAADTNVPYMISVMTSGGLKVLNSDAPWVDFRPTPDPFVFAKSINLGIHGTSDIVILNDDTQVEPWWLDELQAVAYDMDKAAIVSPLVTKVGNPDQHVDNKQTHPDGEVHWTTTDYLCFVCAYIPLEILVKVGPLDEQFSDYGYEDNDFSYRVRMNGHECRVCHATVVDHSCHATFGGGKFTCEMEEKMGKAMEVFNAKWTLKKITALPEVKPRMRLRMREGSEVETRRLTAKHLAATTKNLNPGDISPSAIIETFGDKGGFVAYAGSEVRHAAYIEVLDNQVTLGPRAVLGAFSYVQGNGGVEIGEGTLIGPHCGIYSSGHPDSPAPFADAKLDLAPVIIGKNVFIGEGVTILMGAVIGDDCIIGAKSLITKGQIIPDGSVAVGIPAKVVRLRNIPRERQAGDVIERAHRERYEFAAEYLEDGDYVLDAGCGVGYGSEILATAKAARVVGVDISAPAHAQAVARAGEKKNLSFVNCAIEEVESRIPFDLITAFEVVEHVKDSTALVKHLWKLIRPGGKLILSVPSNRVPATANPHHYRHFSAEELVKMIVDATGARPIGIHNQWRGEHVCADEAWDGCLVVPDYYIAIMERSKP